MPCHLSISNLEKAVDGKILSVCKDSFLGVFTDSRKINKNGLFIPLVGPNHDAHNFLESVAESDVAIILTHEKDIAEKIKGKCSVVLVKDTLKALQSLACYWRKQCKAQVVGITGSNGKTTTKDFLAKILSADYAVTASKNSFNNHWGVPLTLLEANKDDDFIIVEMGMNHQGELKTLSEVALPDIVTVTQVSPAHVGFFKDIEGVARAKEEIYKFNPQAKFIFNLDNKFTRLMCEKYKKEDSIYFSATEKTAHVFMQSEFADLRGLQVKGQIKKITEGLNESLSSKGTSFLSTVLGEYNLYNVMAASALALGLDALSPEVIWKNLRYCSTPWGRGQLYIFKRGSKVLFDGYNANPESMKAFIESAYKINLSAGGRRFFILGEMDELNEQSESFHKDLAGFLALKNPDEVILIGAFSASMLKEMRRRNFKNNIVISDCYKQSLAIQLDSMLVSEDLVFIKGSRKIKLEQFLDDWGLNL